MSFIGFFAAGKTFVGLSASQLVGSRGFFFLGSWLDYGGFWASSSDDYTVPRDSIEIAGSTTPGGVGLVCHRTVRFFISNRFFSTLFYLPFSLFCFLFFLMKPSPGSRKRNVSDRKNHSIGSFLFLSFFHFPESSDVRRKSKRKTWRDKQKQKERKWKKKRRWSFLLVSIEAGPMESSDQWKVTDETWNK